jgi:hypothetical protein
VALTLILFCLGLVQPAQGQTYNLSALWSIGSTGAISHPFLTNDNLARGMAYNPASGHVLVVSRTFSNAVHILDGDTGAVLGKLPMDTNIVKGGTFPVNMIGITTNGVIYVCNLTTDTTNAAAGPLKLYRWENETAEAQLVYSGDPSNVSTNGASPRRYGDSLALRGSGPDTQILLGTMNQTVALLTTADGINFTARKITTDMAASDSRWGLAWGAGNTFWVKQQNVNLKQLSLNLATDTATVIRNLGAWSLITPVAPMDIDLERNLIAFIDTSATGHNLRLYDFSDPAVVVQLDVNKAFGGTNANGNFVGSVSLRNGRLYALDTNRGLLGFALGNATVNVALWEDATWTFKAPMLGTGPYSYQWNFKGAAITGATASSLTIANVSQASQGLYSVTVNNASGASTLNVSTITVQPANYSAKVNNVWKVLPNIEPYLTSGYKEYGMAVNPLTTNVIVVTRPNLTNMIVVLDATTGVFKRYIDYAGFIPANAMNKVDVADDGIVYVCNLTTSTTTPFSLYAFGDDSGAGDKWVAFQGDPGNGQTTATDGWGRTFDIRGGGMETEILVGTLSSTAKTIAILRPDANYAFSSTAITISDAPAGFARLGLCWGPGTNTILGKTLGSVILVEIDINNGTGFVRKTYPQTGSHSVPNSVAGIRFDSASGLLAGLQNGTGVRPVSIPIYDLTDVEVGPLWVDHELFTTYNPDIEYQGNVDFGAGYLVALGVNNGLTAFKVNPSAPTLPVIATQPASSTWYAGSSPTISVVVDSATTPSYQWFFNGTQLIAGATSASLTLTNIQASQAGDYRVRVTNAGGERWSFAATLTLLQTFATAQMTNIWTATAGSRPYLNTTYYEYGMAFNPVNSNLLVASYNPTTFTPTIAVMDAVTGVDKHSLDVTVVSGGNRWLNKIGVAADGVVYAGNRSTAPASDPFVLYRWDTDEPTTIATMAYSGDPLPSVAAKVAGYTMDVRGAGVNTEVILGCSVSNLVSILTTADGTNFVATEVFVPGAPEAFTRLGICWGVGNTFWVKMWTGKLYLVQYDLAAGTGTILHSYPTSQFSSTITTLAYNNTLKFLAGSARDDQKNVQIFSVSDLEAGPKLLDQELFPTYNASIEANGALDFGGNTYLFAMNENNGIMAFIIDSNYQPPSTSFRITNVSAAGGSVTLTWESQSGVTYRVQSTDSVTGTWQNLGSTVQATGATASFTDTPAANRFYRVVSQ